jgi:predicted negative regulator of RcsB-dependent stress response
MVIGINYWRESRNAASEEASEIYTSLTAAQNAGVYPDILSLVATLKDEYSSTPYASKGALIEAREYVEQGKLEDAVVSLHWAMENTEESGVENAARLRLARIMIEQGQLDSAAAMLDIEDYQGFDSQYYELLGDLALVRGDHEGAALNYTWALDNIGEDVGYATIITIKKDSLKVEEE